MEFLEPQVRAIYRLLGHGERSDGYSDLRCILVNGDLLDATIDLFRRKNERAPSEEELKRLKVVNRSIVKGEEAVVAWAKKYNGNGNCFIGRATRSSDGALLELRTVTADIDPDRELGTAATLELSAKALQGAKQVLQRYRGGYLASSGNGALIVYRLSNPVTNDLKAFEPKFKAFEDEMRKCLPQGVTLDATFDSARVAKLLGTISTKGAEKDWRVSRFIDFPVLPYFKNDIRERIEACSDVPSESVGKLPLPSDVGYKSRSEGAFGVAAFCKARGLSREAALAALEKDPFGRGNRYDDNQRIIQKVYGSENGQLDPEQGLQYSHPGEHLDEHRKRLFNRKGNEKPELSIGVELIDRLTWGLRRSEVFTIAARPSIGKTSIAVSIAARMAKEGKRVLFFTSEMSSDTTYDRLLQVLSGVPGDKFNTGNFTDDERVLLDGAYAQLKQFGERLTICDSTSPEISQVTAIANKVTPDLVIYDHIQHIGGETDSARANISRFMRGLKDIARTLDCAVLALSQIKRLYRDQKTGKEIRPTLSDLKESGTIEEESGAVLLLSILSDEPENPVRCLYGELAKNRYGPLAVVGITFHKLTAVFQSMDGESLV